MKTFKEFIGSIDEELDTELGPDGERKLTAHGQEQLKRFKKQKEEKERLSDIEKNSKFVRKYHSYGTHSQVLTPNNK